MLSYESIKKTAVEKVLSVVTGNVKFQKTPDRKFTQEELSQYDTSDENKPVYVAVKGIVYDVSSRKDLYVKGQRNHIFAGKDFSRALAKTSLELEDVSPYYEDLSEEEINMLNRWEKFYQKKYPVVGSLIL
ncbi:cytochrome b5 [Neocallimastix lanati (nom. inval.)]|jgi:predicted heme/steroid binding protein|nr:cytochrome b5 [Neocallimastix sp. JGI-2020a]